MNENNYSIVIYQDCLDRDKSHNTNVAIEKTNDNLI